MSRKGKNRRRNSNQRDLPESASLPDHSSRLAPTANGDRGAAAAVCGLLVLAVVAIYGQTLRFDFVNYDDDEFVYENPHVVAGLTSEGVAWAFSTRVLALWTPLTFLSLMADAQLMRSGAGPPDVARLAAEMHAVNLALHAANAALLFLVLRAMTGRLWPSALAAAVFAVHPLRVESVAWITERKDVLSGLFGLLALACYAWYVRHGGMVRYLLVAVTLALGLMAKPMLTTWPLVFLLLDYWPLRREITAAVLLEKVPLLLLAAAFASVALLGQPSREAVFTTEAVPLPARFARAAELYVIYLGKTVWPVNLVAIYPVPAFESLWPVLAAGSLLALLTAAALWGARHAQRWLAVGWFWYLIMLAPVIGLVHFGSVVIADRFLYLPQIGLCMALAWTVDQVIRTAPRLRPVLAVASLVVVAALGACTHRQASYWKDSVTLWTHALATAPATLAANNNLGNALDRCGRHKEAVGYLEKVVAARPGYAKAHFNLGTALLHDGQSDKALAAFREALLLDPNSAAAHVNVGIILGRGGQYDEAIRHFRQAIEIQPGYVEARHDLDVALRQKDTSATNAARETTDKAGPAKE
jgi:tetratricopeptide (TPR) repeat protein